MGNSPRKDAASKRLVAEEDCSAAPCSASFVRLFKPQFAELVEAGTKRQTVRPTPKRMPKPSDKISLRCWTGKPYRSPQRVLREAVIVQVDTVKIGTGIVVNGESLNCQQRALFAQADGFECPNRMYEWFEETHGLPFVGIVIHWQNAQVMPCEALASTPCSPS